MRLRFVIKHLRIEHLCYLILIALVLLVSISCGDMVADDDNPEDLLMHHGHEYEVWGKSPGGGDCLDPGGSGFTYMGSGYNTQSFMGAYDEYIILARPGNFAFVDAVQNQVGIPLNVNYSCNTNEDGAVNGFPDGEFAWVNTEHSRNQPGSIVITATSTSITVFIVEDAYYWDD